MKLITRVFCLMLCFVVCAVSAFAAETPVTALGDARFSLPDAPDLGEILGDLGDLESLDLSGLTEDIRALAKDCGSMDDDALAQRIQELAEARGIPISEKQVQSLAELLRKANTELEKGDAIRSGAETAKQRTGGFFRSLQRIFQRAADLFRKLGDLFQ